MTAKQILTPRKGAPRSPWIREQESRACRRCGAEPGHQCVTTVGTFAMRPHMERYYDAGGTPEGDPQRACMVERRHANKRRVFAHYGTSCACCGTTKDLTIDHIDGNGKEHREEVTGGSSSFYAWLVRNGFPAGYQTLCATCNLSKGRGEHCRIHEPVCPTCRRPLDEGVILAARGSRARSTHVAVPAESLAKAGPTGRRHTRRDLRREGAAGKIAEATGLVL